MGSDRIPIPKGSIVVMTSGVYSDFQVRGVFRARSEIDVDQLRWDWVRDHPDQGLPGTFNEDQFVAHLCRLDLIEQIEWHEFFLSMYSDIDNVVVERHTVGNDD